MRALLLATAMILAIPATAQAVPAYPIEIFTKLGRGLSNVATSGSEIYINSYKQAKRVGLQPDYADYTNTDVHVAAFAGGVVGIGYAFMRLGVGFFDVVTFPWPTDPWVHPPTPPVYLEGVMEK